MLTKYTKKISSLALLSFLLVTGLFVASFMFVRTQGVLLHERVSTVLTQREREQAYRELEQAVKNSLTQREEIDRYILSEQETIDFLSNIENDAAQIGVVLKTDSLNVTQPKTAVPKTKGKATTTPSINTGFATSDMLTVVFTITGPRVSVETMVQMLETLPYLSYINRLSLTESSATLNSEAGGVVALLELVVGLKKI